MKLIQNRLRLLLNSRERRLEFYRRVFDRRITEVEKNSSGLQVPRLRGLRLRLPAKPFHATPEFFFQEGGTTRFLLPNETLNVGPRKAALIPSGMPHGEKWTGSQFLNVIVMVQEEGFSLHLGYLQEVLRCGPIDRFRSPARTALVRYADEIATAGTTRAARLVRNGLYLACLARFREGLDSRILNDQPHPLLQRCIELVGVHFTRMDFSVTWLARELGCSSDHLSRLFRRETGGRLIQFIHQKRTDYASRLLHESDMNIAETAWACGYRQPSYFNRIFLAHTGLKPNQFRKNSGVVSGD